MRIKRKTWTKDSLIQFLGVESFYETNPKCEVLCHNEGCLFEVELKECSLSYLDIGDDGEHEYEAYWTCNCPRCDKEIILTKENFEDGNKT